MSKNGSPTPRHEEPSTTNRAATSTPAPADAVACAALGCRRTEDLERVERADGKTRTLCPSHRKYFLGVSS